MKRKGMFRLLTCLLAVVMCTTAFSMTAVASNGGAEYEELGVLVRGVAGIEQAAQFGVADGVVEVLARTVDARERLFVQQAEHAVALCHAA